MTRQVNPVHRTTRRCLLIATLASMLSGSGAWPQTPTLKIVSPFPAGGSSGALLRLLADHIGRTHGVTVVVEHRTGAGALIATEAVLRAAPDGNTLLVNANSFVISPHVRKLSYDPLTAFEPICWLVSSPQVLVVNGASPYRTLGDLFDAARQRPGELNIASLGPATAQHVAVEKLKSIAGIDMTFLPYPGNMQAVTALLGAHVTSVLANFGEVAEQLNAGTLRALATASRFRTELLPDVPTIAEQGFPDYDETVWIGVVAPARTPHEIVARLSSWFAEALEAPDVKPKLRPLGLTIVAQCGAAFAAHIHRQFEDYGRQLREANIKAE
jgi:tripartite-type tricarboxylate transporter receptor subunit TctC